MEDWPEKDRPRSGHARRDGVGGTEGEGEESLALRLGELLDSIFVDMVTGMRCSKC